MLSKTYKNAESKDVKILGVCNTTIKQAEDYKNELIRLGVQCLNTYGESSILKKTFKLYNVTTFPAIFILDKDKKIVFKQVSSKDVISYLSRI